MSIRLPIAAFACVWFLSSCCQAPPISYDSSSYLQSRIHELQNDFINLLPPEQQKLPAAREEAAWLADTAYRASARIARDNSPLFIGWINNILVNSHVLNRGLCYHYQQDLYRELRRRPLHYFFLGLTIRDRGTGRSHSCVYVSEKNKRLKDALVLDPWKHCGHLIVIPPEDRENNWEESSEWQSFIEEAFPEGHTYPFRSYIRESINTGNAEDDD